MPPPRIRPQAFFGKEILGCIDLERLEPRRVLIVENPFLGRGGIGTELRILLYLLLRELAIFVRHV